MASVSEIEEWEYSRIDVHPIAGALGAEGLGVDITRGDDDETLAGYPAASTRS